MLTSILFDPNYIDVLFNKGESYRSLNEHKKAIQDFNLAIELNPKSSDAYLYRGMSKIDLGDKEGGCLDYSKAGELGNTNAYNLIKRNCN